MAGFGRHHRDLDRGPVAHFANQNDFRRLTQRRAQSGRIIVEVVSKLALIERRLALRMHVLDRIFEGNDVDRLRIVDLVENGSQGCGLAATGGTCDQDKACFFLRDLVKDFRQPQ